MKDRQFFTILLDNPVCNFSCKYCGLCESHDKNSLVLRHPVNNFDVIDELIDTQLPKDSEGRVTIRLWGGEPLFNQNFWPFIRHLSNTFKLKSVGFVTNGSLLYPFRKEIEKYDFWEFNVSNDLMYQTSRGEQYLESGPSGDCFFDFLKRGWIKCIQTVVGHHSSHVYENLEYLRSTCNKHSFDYHNIGWFLIPLRDYSCSNKDLLLTLEDRIFVEQFSRLLIEALLDNGINRIYSSIRERLQRELEAMTTPVPDCYTPHCESFRDNKATFVTLTGERYYCTENFDRGIKGNNLVVPTEECLKCVFQGSCNGGCANHSNEFRKFNCSGWKAWHAVMQRVLYTGLSDEQRRRYHDLHGTSDMYRFITSCR